MCVHGAETCHEGQLLLESQIPGSSCHLMCRHLLWTSMGQLLAVTGDDAHGGPDSVLFFNIDDRKSPSLSATLACKSGSLSLKQLPDLTHTASLHLKRKAVAVSLATQSDNQAEARLSLTWPPCAGSTECDDSILAAAAADSGRAILQTQSGDLLLYDYAVADSIRGIGSFPEPCPSMYSLPAGMTSLQT